MMDQPTCEFVVLAYVSDVAQGDLLPVAFAARELGSDDARGLILHVSAVLGTVVSKPHLDYMYEIFEDWREASSDKLDDLFRELRELSAGPLRTQNYGFCPIGDLTKLVNQVFEAKI
jgi:hypothetical protein